MVRLPVANPSGVAASTASIHQCFVPGVAQER
jgi:hypothetical protein